MTDKQLIHEDIREDIRLNAKRLENEENFINALLCGVLCKKAKLEDGFAICPLQFLQKGTDAYKLGHAMLELDKAGIEITTDTMADKIKQLYKDFDLARLGEVFSVYGNEDAIKHFAQMAYREAIKRQAMPEIYTVLKECKTYGDNIDTIDKLLCQIKNNFEQGSMENASVGAIYHTILADILSNKVQKPVSTGYKKLDSVLKGGFAKGELVVLAARPGCGKTAFASCLASNIAEQGKQVLFISREVKDVTLVQRMIARRTKIDNRYFREGADNLPHMKERIAREQAYFERLPLQIVEKSTAPMTAREVRRIARGIKNIGFVVIDYLQLLNSEEKSQNREREIAEMSRAFKQLALDLDIPVLLLSQLNRSIENANRLPQLSDLRESGAIEQDADIVIFIHADKADLLQLVTYTEMIVAKGRSSGTGIAYFQFEKPFSNFIETEKRTTDQKEEKTGIFF